MSSSPSNLKLALDAYDAQQRRQAALIEAQRIGTLIHIQEQQLLAAKHLAKRRKSQRRRVSSNTTINTTADTNTSQPTMEDVGECAIEDEEEDLVLESIVSAPAPICPSLAARRAARSAAKRASLLPPNPVLESIPEPDHEPAEETPKCSASEQFSSNHNNIIARWASHKRRPQEPYAALASRSQWKPDSQATFCDNILCKKPFTLFGPQSRHHCRRCGNIFCASCLSHIEVLYDMDRSEWPALPEQLISSIFLPGPSPADHPKQREPIPRPAPAPSSPASFTSTNLSDSIESGSSRASTSSSSYFTLQPSSLRLPITDPLHTVHRVPKWCLGTDELLPSPVPAEWRDHLLDIASEEKVCEECHDELWDCATPVERHYARRAFNREREEMAWALSVVGLERWEEILRNHDLSLKPSPRERKEEKKARRASSSTTTTSTQSRSSRHTQPWSFPLQGDVIPTASFAPGVKAEQGLDFLDRPTYPHVYAWVTAPPCIRFTSGAFKPAPAPTPSHTEPAPTPSPFGMLKSPAKFLPPPLPASYLAAHLPAAAHVPSGEEREEIRQERYTAAVAELVKTAYRKGVPCDHLDGGVMGVRYVVEPTPLELWRKDMECRMLDLAARWRGDPVGC